MDEFKTNTKEPIMNTSFADSAVAALAAMRPEPRRRRRDNVTDSSPSRPLRWTAQFSASAIGEFERLNGRRRSVPIPSAAIARVLLGQTR
jgi:hypothetical protein